MAETAVNLVLGRIADILLKEVEFLGGVGDQMESVKRELARIQCFLSDAESKRKQDKRARHWVNEVRDVACQIEDAIDEYFVEINYNRRKNLTFLSSITLFKLPLGAVHRLGSKIVKIQEVLREISESKDRYEVCLDQGKEQEPKQHMQPRYAFEDLDETEVVGYQDVKNNILSLVLDTKLSRRIVIAIEGLGGIGKATLAQMVYKSAKAAFDYHIWLTISEEYNLSDILRKMISNIIFSEPKVQYNDHLMSELKSLLSGKRYLIIMEDIWNRVSWDQLRAALPDEKNGSRVLMTCRTICSGLPMRTYRLRLCGLNEKESLDLLLQKALPFQNPGEICSDLLEVAKSLSKKCCGLPLALIVVGGILSTKEPSYTAWERVLRTMDWHSDGDHCMGVLAMNYEDMPHHLKTGFKYFASFPRDYEISAKQLIRMWTAEGFIPRTASRTMEEAAEDCLDELVQRCMVQVSSRCTDGSIKYCIVHGLLLDLAVSEAEKDNFITVFSEGRNLHQPNRSTRRSSLQFCSSDELMKDIHPKTRSFLCFGEVLPNFSEFKLLKVIHIESVQKNINLMGLDWLINLKYLGFRNCKYVHVDPPLFGQLLNLETLDLRGTPIEPHSSLWKIGTLRHVELSKPSSGPTSSAKLENLQTLRWVLVLKTWQEKLPRLTNLRILGLENPFTDWDTVTKVLTTLSSLVSLGLKGDRIPLEIVDMRPLPSYRNLQSLYLEGKWLESIAIKVDLFPPHLVKLTLAGSMLWEDPLLELAKLKNLRKLRLLQHSYLGKKMICPTGGFILLQKLELSQLTELEVWEVMKESMPKLTYLKICGCPKLRVLPPEVQHLTELKLESMPHDFNIRTQGQDDITQRNVADLGVTVGAQEKSEGDELKGREVRELGQAELKKEETATGPKSSNEIPEPLESDNSGDRVPPSQKKRRFEEAPGGQAGFN